MSTNSKFNLKAFVYSSTISLLTVLFEGKCKMYKSVFVICFFVASVVTADYEYSPEYSYGDEEYVLVPISRVRRQVTSLGVDGTRATLSHTGTLVNNNNHHLSGTGFASKQFKPNGPLTTGGNLDYTHKPSGSTLGVGAANTRGYGTDFSASGRYNFYNKGNTNAFAEGNYNRHYRGPGGTGRPNYYVGLGVEHRF